MSFSDFQRAATLMLRHNQRFLGAEFSRWAEGFNLTDDERKNLTFLCEDRAARRYAERMSSIRLSIALQSIPQSLRWIGREKASRIFSCDFDQRFSDVRSMHLGYRFANYLLEDASGQKIREGTPDYVEDLLKFERAAAFLRSFEVPRMHNEHSSLLHSSFQVVDLTFDILNFISTDLEHPQPRAHTLLMMRGATLDKLRYYEIDRDLADFLLSEVASLGIKKPEGEIRKSLVTLGLLPAPS